MLENPRRISSPNKGGIGWLRLGETLPRHGGAPQAPNAADPDQRITFLCGGRGGPAHLLDLRRGKGRPSSRCSISFWRSSLSMLTSPSFCCNRAISRSRASWGCFFSTARPQPGIVPATSRAGPQSRPVAGRAAPGLHLVTDAQRSRLSVGRKSVRACCPPSQGHLRSPYGLSSDGPGCEPL
jgi:hypothetical protein